MTSAASRFKLVNRGFKDTLLLVPGWATDHRIFGRLNLDFNYLMPVDIEPFDFNKGLIEKMVCEKIDNISILGWSLGAFLAAGFISAYPGKAAKIFFVGARRKYGKEELEIARVNIIKNRKAYLYKFYGDFFSNTEDEARRWFKGFLLKSYLNDMSEEILLDGLDYLSVADMDGAGLEKMPVKFIHGREDKIAPLAETLKLKEGLPRAEFSILESAGHAPFLSSNFKDIIING